MHSNIQVLVSFVLHYVMYLGECKLVVSWPWGGKKTTAGNYTDNAYCAAFKS